jgi:uncharacterized protein (DUF934 family)
MRIIKGGAIVEDGFSHLTDTAELPASGDVIVSLERFVAQRDALRERSGGVGVRLRSDQEAKTVAEYLPELALVAVEFPGFKDGRGYTTARMLRDRYAYKGEIRAVGDVLREWLFYMQRCGFDAFELKPGKDLDAAVAAFADFSVKYQGASDDPRPLFRRRAQSG